jgi:hypothetical protein
VRLVFTDAGASVAVLMIVLHGGGWQWRLGFVGGGEQWNG